MERRRCSCPTLENDQIHFDNTIEGYWAFESDEGWVRIVTLADEGATKAGSITLVGITPVMWESEAWGGHIDDYYAADGKTVVAGSNEIQTGTMNGLFVWDAIA